MDSDVTSFIAIVIVAHAVLAARLARLFRGGGTVIVQCAPAADGGAQWARWPRPDVVIIDGAAFSRPASVVARARRRWPAVNLAVVNVPDPRSVTALLDGGADDAIVEGCEQLPYRLRAMTRRARTVRSAERLAVGQLAFDRVSHHAWCMGGDIALTEREGAVLECLLRRSPLVVRRTDLADYVWGDARAARRGSVLDVYIASLRRKLAATPAVALETVRSVGYRLTIVPGAPAHSHSIVAGGFELTS